jgi:hypothetical protein
MWGSFHVGPKWQLAGVQLVKANGVGINSFLFEITHKSVAEFWSNQIHHEVEVEKNDLRSSNSHSKNDSWISQFEEDEEVQPLVIGLLEKMMNPSMVLLQCSQTPEVSDHTSDHAWDSCYRLEKNYSVKPVSLVHFLWVISRDCVETCSHGSDHS